MIALEESAVDAPETGRPHRPRSSGRAVRQLVAAGFLAVLFLVVTKGPVFWIRLEAAPLTKGFLADPWIQAVFVTAAALVLMLAAPGIRVLLADRFVVIAFSAFHVIVLGSSLWSVNRAETVQQSTMFVLGTAAELSAGAYVRRVHAVVALWLAMQAGVSASLVAWGRGWPRAFMRWGDFAGIYFHKNSLGPVAALGVASSVALAAIAWRRGNRWIVVVPVATAGLDGYVWLRSNSLGAVFGLGIAAGTVALFALMVPGRGARFRRPAGVMAAGVAGVAALLALVNLARINAWLDRPNTLTGRPQIWEFVLDHVAGRPIRGWGFMAFWTQPELGERFAEAGRQPVFEAHSGYLEVLLGVGVVGLVALAVLLAVVVARVGWAMWSQPSLLAAWSAFLVVFALATNVVETFVGPNLIIWTLLCVATGQAIVTLHRHRPPTDGADEAPVASGDHLAGGDEPVFADSFSFDDLVVAGDRGDDTPLLTRHPLDTWERDRSGPAGDPPVEFDFSFDVVDDTAGSDPDRGVDGGGDGDDRWR